MESIRAARLPPRPVAPAGGSWGDRRLPQSGPMASAPAGVLNAVGLDQPAVDRGLLVSFTDAVQFREEERPIAGQPGVEPGVKRAEDGLPRVQALGLLP